MDRIPGCKTCIIRMDCGGGCRGIHTSFTSQYAISHPLFCAHLRRSFEVKLWSSSGGIPATRTTRFHGAAQDRLMRIPVVAV